MKNWILEKKGQLRLFLCILFLLSYFSINTLSAAEEIQTENKIYTDSDLKALEKKPATKTQPVIIEHRDPTSKYLENLKEKQKQKNYESWCEAGTKYRNIITRTNRDILEAEEEYKTAIHEYEIYKLYNGKMGRPYDYIQAKNKLKNAKEQLKKAEEDLSELEEKAHRKDIKPGWLRCQE